MRVSIATQLNSSQLDVELSCVAINGPLVAVAGRPERRPPGCVRGGRQQVGDVVTAESMTN